MEQADGWGTTGVWTLDPDRVVVLAQENARASGLVVHRSSTGVRVLDLVFGLVTEAVPRASGYWVAWVWQVTDVPPAPAPALGRAGQIVAPRLFATWKALTEHADSFTFAAEVVLADRAGRPDAAVLVRPDVTGGWVPQGANPGGLVLTRIVQATRDAIRQRM